MNQLQVNNLSIYFPSEHQKLTAVESVDFTLKPGKTTALLGESGCGKSITSSSIMRLLPQGSFYGKTSSIHIDETNLLELPEFMMRQFRGKRIAMIFQEPMSALNPVLTIGQQIHETIKCHFGDNDKDLKNQMISLLKEVEMPEPEVRLEQYPHQLSGGQKQRVVIALALACQPEILIADEPTTALDVTIQAQILDLLKRIQAHRQMSMLFITHDIHVVKLMADDVCLMYAGRIVARADVNLFFKNPLHPYAAKLLQSVPDIEQRGYSLSTIKGSVPSLQNMPAGCHFHPRCDFALPVCSIERPEGLKISNQSVACHLYPKQTEPLIISHVPIAHEHINHDATIMTVNNLSVYFYQKRAIPWKKTHIIKAVDGISFDLKAGKTLALVGESGCGKTTTGRAIIKLIKPSLGDIKFYGTSISDMSRTALRQYRQQVQMIFQDPFSSLNPRMTIREILSEGMLAKGFKENKNKHQLHELLELVNLPVKSLNRYPHQFSGGQRQRICIARALALDPKIIICDEPTSALDISVQAQILNLLKELQIEKGLAYLFITHDMSVVSWVADEIMVMNAGKVVESGKALDVLTSPKHAYTIKLLQAVPDKQIKDIK